LEGTITARLEHTQKPISLLVEELKQGELGFPEIQRGYVWNRSQARDLIDSLYREYPSGLILLWKPKELPELREGPGGLMSRGRPDYLIIDGQQRLTSLSRVFDGTINVYFNVEDEVFQVYSTKLKANPFWVSVKDVLNGGAITALLNLQRNSNLDAEKQTIYGQRLERLARIKDYLYPVMIIHTDDYEEVAESFTRINSRGTRLREAELAMARLAFPWSGSIVREFEKALDEYEQANYDFEARFLMRCYVAVATNQSRFRHLGALWQKSQAELEAIWKRTKNAIDHAIDFLKNNAGIESLDWIQSINALVPLVGWFSKKDQLSEAEARGLLFWFFEATIHGRFTGSPEARIDQDLRAIDSTAPLENMIANLRREIGSFEVTPEMLEGKHQRHPFVPLLFVIFRKNGAADWFTGTILSSTNVGASHQLEFHHVFPKAILKQSGRYDSDKIDDVANIVFLSQKANRAILQSPPEKYLPGIEREKLRAQLIPLDEYLWRVEKFEEFVKEIRERKKKFIGQGH